MAKNMLKSWLFFYVLLAFVATVLAQGPPASVVKSFKSEASAASASSASVASAKSKATANTSSATSKGNNAKTTSAATSTSSTRAKSHTTSVVSSSRTQSSNNAIAHTTNGAHTATGAGSHSSGTGSLSQSSANGGSSAGNNSAKSIGIGVGVGVGVALIAAIVALVFFLRRRRRNDYESEKSAAQFQNRPAMASGAPALAGVADLGRSPSTHSSPAPSEHAMEAEEPAETPAIASTSQQSLSKAAPPRLTLRAQTPEQEALMPPPAYHDHEYAPSPLEEHSGAVSPVSPISPADSRPPSPLHEND